MRKRMQEKCIPVAEEIRTEKEDEKQIQGNQLKDQKRLAVAGLVLQEQWELKSCFERLPGIIPAPHCF